jgi:hypothetical protein
MIQLIKYLMVFILGAVVMAHNPKLISSVTAMSDLARTKIVELTGKAGREAERQKEIAEEKKKQLEKAKQQETQENE